ncbi:hypothetical protein [Endozoicomonas numazuensis]|nr:hypothetical protein [Endozoicomonas numazuensis]
MSNSDKEAKAKAQKSLRLNKVKADAIPSGKGATRATRSTKETKN